jgi:hypothetical protein
MPYFKATGWEKGTAREVTWYLDAATPMAARFYALDAGLATPNVEQIKSIPEGESVINVESTLSSGRGSRQAHPLDGLVWRIALGVMLGVLGAAIVLFLLSGMFSI